MTRRAHNLIVAQYKILLSATICHQRSRFRSWRFVAKEFAAKTAALARRAENSFCMSNKIDALIFSSLRHTHVTICYFRKIVSRNLVSATDRYTPN